MKTYLKTSSARNHIFHLALIALFGLASLDQVMCQEKKVFIHDYLLPGKGKSMVEFYTGIPYVTIGQYNYGFSDRFSAGFLYGHTPFVKGFGLRIKAVMAQPSESFRVNVKSPFIYYPHMNPGDGEAWVLAWPTVNGEWKLKNGARIWTGVGLIGAACVEYLFNRERGHNQGDDHSGHPWPEGMPLMEKEEEMTSLFNTFQFGYSKPLSDKWSFLIEVAPVMEGFKIKSPNGFLDTAPVIVTLGLAHSF